jgi:hypothetical protein
VGGHHLAESFPRRTTGGDLETYIVFELGGNAFAALSPDVLDIKLGEDDGHSQRATTSASRGSAFRGSVGGLGVCRLVGAVELGHRGLRQIATLGHLSLVMGLDHEYDHQSFDRPGVRERPTTWVRRLIYRWRRSRVRRPHLAPVGLWERREGRSNLPEGHGRSTGHPKRGCGHGSTDGT